MKLTRRDLVVAAAGSALAVKALAQSPPDSNPAPRDFGKEAHDAIQRNADALAKYPVPVATEPAFRFKA